MTEVLRTIRALTEGERNGIANMANTAALLGSTMPNINWIGFYIASEPQLILGPFWGKPACIRIDFGDGVCGTAAATKSVQQVDDVHTFDGHIACDANSRSEVVVPIIHDGRVVAVLDVDSPYVANFTDEDVSFYKEVADIISAGCDW